MTRIRDGYPRPQFIRKQWMNLNGEWDFEFDDENLGLGEKWYLPHKEFSQKIQVPFVYQSKLSGIEKRSFHDIVWYKKMVNIPKEWKGQRIVLHFGAVDYTASIWVNGKFVKRHEGGHTPFSIDITDDINEDATTITVRTEDYSKDLSLPRGKQYWKERSEGIFYTGSTGIWQTVWLEPVYKTHLDRVKMVPNIDENEITIRSFINRFSKEKNVKLRTRIMFQGKTIIEDVIDIYNSEETRTIKISGDDHYGYVHLWSPEEPNLYTVHFTLYENDVIIDEVESYFGMRKISVENGKLCLNNRPYFKRMVLDQGYYPEGLLTAPSDCDIKNDVLIAKKLGFNGVRKHQKLEDPRFLYWCDQLGLLVWGEFASARKYSEQYVNRYTKEWLEVIERDFNHPSIVVWVPINESWGVPDIQRNEQQQHHVLSMYHLLKSLDPTRLVVSNDGWEHMATDLCTIHDYHSSYKVLKDRYNNIENIYNFKPHFGGRNIFVREKDKNDQPILVTECGGISFEGSKAEQSGWGYSGAGNEEEFLEMLKDVINPLLNSPYVQGFCYTQLVDVEQETNGLLTYYRKAKVDFNKIKEIIDAPTYDEKHYGTFIT